MCSILSYALASLAVVATVVVAIIGGLFLWAVFNGH